MHISPLAFNFDHFISISIYTYIHLLINSVYIEFVFASCSFMFIAKQGDYLQLLR